MLNQIRSFIEKKHMLDSGDRVLIGVSGGADSMCLLNVLMNLAKDYQLTLFAVHVNHGIRGAESDQEEEYVKSFCEKHKIEISCFRVHVLELAKQQGKSVEEVGRNIRYDLFYKQANRLNCHKIAIAHNMNDNAETLLFHLFRGSMLKGASAISPVRDLIIRPLLETKREMIEDWLDKQQISYCVDSSNLSLDYTRNRIRSQILPVAIHEINSKTIEHLSQFTSHMDQISEFISKLTKKLFDRIAQFDDEKLVINLEELNKEEPVLQQSLMKYAIERFSKEVKDIDSNHIRSALSLINKQSGKEIHLPHHIIVKRGYTTLILDRIKKQEDRNTLSYIPKIPGEWNLKEASYQLKFNLIEMEHMMDIPKNCYTKWFDYDKIKDVVVIRTRKSGDFIQVNKEGGRKTLKSLFIDEKIPKEKREKMYLIAAGNHVLWLPGIRTSEAFLVDDKTKRILSITLECEEIR